ncbi:hypothetical protein [Nocardiopsis sp. NPDC057823]|uniref:hypothetical protein n=1 Tax=Nocardiopsis TaxID=2013 RepID=UPI00366F5E53
MLPVVWLLGASGVGKSTVGYRMLSAAADAGVTAAFVDADQLRLAAGVTATETGLIASALPALSRGYRAHGAEVLVVAGQADGPGHLARLLPGVPRDRVLAVHLDADADTIRERVRRRGWLVGLADEAAEHAARLDPGAADVHVDTVGRSPADIAAQVAAAALGGPLRTTADDDAPAPGAAPRRTAVVTGPGGAGLSTAGFGAFSRIARAGEAVGYLDAHQLGFLGTRTRADRLAPLRAANTRVAAANLARGGAGTVLVSGDPRTARLLRRLWDPGDVAVFWLHASPAVLAERITRRARGDGPAIPGDHRAGLSGPALSAAVDAAVRESRLPRPSGARVIDTDGLDAAQVAAAIAAALP